MGLHVGTSGWSYPHWRGVLYPEGLPTSRWFERYAREFRTVEINATFYRLPPEATFDQWREQAPHGFVYAVKANRFLTHVKKLRDAEAPLRRFLEAALHLGPALGPILFQLPPAWRPDLDRLRAFVALLPKGPRFVFEFRNPDWMTPALREMLERRGLGCCLHDMKDFTGPRWSTGPLTYLRLHGQSREAPMGSYPARSLRPWAERLAAEAAEGREVWAYFNNDRGGHAVRNARTLGNLLDERVPERA